MTFTGQAKATLNVSIPPGVLQPWSNTVTLTAQNGDYDTSLVEYIRITYPHAYVADGDQLKFTGRAGDEVKSSNFDSAPAVLDITDPNRPVQLTPQVISYATASMRSRCRCRSRRRIRERRCGTRCWRSRMTEIASAAGVWPNHPSHWHSAQAGADIAMVTYGPFAAALDAAGAALTRRKGSRPPWCRSTTCMTSSISASALRMRFAQFLQTANQNWKKPPTYLLLNGRASLDPRNYLGFGSLDLVPTRMVQSSQPDDGVGRLVLGLQRQRHADDCYWPFAGRHRGRSHDRRRKDRGV